MQITNTSALSVEYQLRLGSDKIHLNERTQLTDYYRRQDHLKEYVIGQLFITDYLINNSLYVYTDNLVITVQLL